MLVVLKLMLLIELISFVVFVNMLIMELLGSGGGVGMFEGWVMGGALMVFLIWKWNGVLLLLLLFSMMLLLLLVVKVMVNVVDWFVVSVVLFKGVIRLNFVGKVKVFRFNIVLLLLWMVKVYCGELFMFMMLLLLISDCVLFNMLILGVVIWMICIVLFIM